MKITSWFITITTTLAMTIMTMGNLYATSTCDALAAENHIEVDIINDLSPFDTVNDALSGYSSNANILVEDTYCLIFDFLSGPLTLLDGQNLSLTVAGVHNVYIEGLELENQADRSLTDPLLTLTNDQPNQTVTLKDITFSAVKYGLKLSGTGLFLVEGATITGNDQEASCIFVDANDTALDNLTISNCSDGVTIDANDVTISDSTIIQNKLGVHVYTGHTGTDTTNSLIYGNFDGDPSHDARLSGIRIEENERDLSFLDIVNDSWIEPEPVESTFIYEAKTAYVKLSEELSVNGRIEMYYTNPSDCGVEINTYGQACKIVSSDFCSLKVDDLNSRKYINCSLSAGVLNKSIVMLYFNPSIGVAPISMPFSMQPADQTDVDVVFVMTPYDIPTQGGNLTGEDSGGNDSGDVLGNNDTGGASDSDSDSGSNGGSGDGEETAGAVDNGGATSMGGDSGGSATSGSSGGGSVDSLISAAPVGCTLMAGNTLITMAWGSSIWWIILTGIFLAAIRKVAVAVKKQ